MKQQWRNKCFLHVFFPTFLPFFLILLSFILPWGSLLVRHINKADCMDASLIDQNTFTHKYFSFTLLTGVSFLLCLLVSIQSCFIMQTVQKTVLTAPIKGTLNHLKVTDGWKRPYTISFDLLALTRINSVAVVYMRCFIRTFHTCLTVQIGFYC